MFTIQENPEPDLICQHVPRKVSTQMGERLSRPFTDEVVKSALFQMKPGKSQGEDGFMAGFFQKHWELLGKDLTNSVLGFLNGGVMPEAINRTILVLIPKVSHLQELTNFGQSLYAMLSTRYVQKRWLID